jgi:hypothetical protein
LVALVPQPYYLLAHHWPPISLLPSFLSSSSSCTVDPNQQIPKYSKTPKLSSLSYSFCSRSCCFCCCCCCSSSSLVVFGFLLGLVFFFCCCCCS